VLQVDGDRAEVMYDGIPTWVAVHGIPGVTVGEYLVVYAGQALERLPKDDAEEMLQFYADLERMVGEAVE
jgi:hydrogenase maturation factor